MRPAYWDANIIAAARQLGCSRLLSEDLNAGQVYADVVADIPFELQIKSTDILSVIEVTVPSATSAN